MLQEKLRVSSNAQEIKEFFREYVRIKSPVMLWQNIENIDYTNTKRIIYNGHFSLLDELKDILVLTYDVDPDQPMNFDVNSTLYIKGKLHSILFKVEIEYHSKGKVLLQIPKEIRVRERRSDVRSDFGYNYKGKVEFFKVNQYDMRKKQQTARLINISKGGLAMLLFTRAHNWSPGDTLQVGSICNYVFPNMQNCEIRNIRQVTISRNQQNVNAYRLGLKFETPLDNEALEKILANCPVEPEE